MTREEYNKFGKQILEACFSVHMEYGPGLLESIYMHALMMEFDIRQVGYQKKVAVPLFYKGLETGKYFEIDLLVENEIIIETKAVEALHPVHEAQLISYLKLSNKKLGYLVNFNVVVIKDGFKRFVNNF